ncbi:MAG: hypothetical protein LBC89_04660 [Bacteroidales bacterium]|nr:hypothetical protein [Bacteroidales bacterium]
MTKNKAFPAASSDPPCWDKVLPCPPLSAQALPAVASLLAGAACQDKPDEAQPRPN